MSTQEATDLATALLAGDPPRFNPHTGTDLHSGDTPNLSPGAAAGFEPPRYCQLCGRRMVVQVRPDGWSARCSRHGSVDSALLESQR